MSLRVKSDLVVLSLFQALSASLPPTPTPPSPLARERAKKFVFTLRPRGLALRASKRAGAGRCRVLTFSPRKGMGPSPLSDLFPFPHLGPHLSTPCDSKARICTHLRPGRWSGGVLIVGTQACWGTCTELDHSTLVWRGRGMAVGRYCPLT